jgi:hypothetical protein
MSKSKKIKISTEENPLTPVPGKKIEAVYLRDGISFNADIDIKIKEKLTDLGLYHKEGIETFMKQYDELTNMTFDRVSKLSTRDILGTIRLWMFQPEESDWNLAVPEKILPIFQEIYHRNTILFLYYL